MTRLLHIRVRTQSVCVDIFRDIPTSVGFDVAHRTERSTRLPNTFMVRDKTLQARRSYITVELVPFVLLDCSHEELVVKPVT